MKGLGYMVLRCRVGTRFLQGRRHKVPGGNQIFPGYAAQGAGWERDFYRGRGTRCRMGTRFLQGTRHKVPDGNQISAGDAAQGAGWEPDFYRGRGTRRRMGTRFLQGRRHSWQVVCRFRGYPGKKISFDYLPKVDYIRQIIDPAGEARSPPAFLTNRYP